MRNFMEAVGRSVIVTSPEPVPENNLPSLFLAGSIDMNSAVEWQQEVIRALHNSPVMIFNPRRDDWDSTWEQDISDPNFSEQVNWEMDRLDDATHICVFFDPDGKAPITLMELGLHAASGKVLVCCPEGYWRRGNVQIVCDRYQIPLFDSLDDMITDLKARFNS